MSKKANFSVKGSMCLQSTPRQILSPQCHPKPNNSFRSRGKNHPVSSLMASSNRQAHSVVSEPNQPNQGVKFSQGKNTNINYAQGTELVGLIHRSPSICQPLLRYTLSLSSFPDVEISDFRSLMIAHRFNSRFLSGSTSFLPQHGIPTGGLLSVRNTPSLDYKQYESRCQVLATHKLGLDY